jgi:two-component system CheB/CheR fusion protein
MSQDPELATQAVEAAADAIVTLDQTGEVTSWNEGAERLFGFGRDEAFEHGLALVIPPEFRSRHVAAFHAAVDNDHLAQSGSVARVEAVTASGERVVLGLSLGLLPTKDGKTSGVVGVLRPLGGAAVEFAAPAEGDVSPAP